MIFNLYSENEYLIQINTQLWTLQYKYMYILNADAKDI